MLSKMPLLSSLVDILSGSVYCGRFSPHHTPTTLMQFLTALEDYQDLLEEAENTLTELEQVKWCISIQVIVCVNCAFWLPTNKGQIKTEKNFYIPCCGIGFTS